MEKSYICIDLKSFYASVECIERGLDPLTTNLVVADISRTNKTICLAVSPSMKAYGLPGRCRLFEVEQKEKEINNKRIRNAYGHVFSGSSYDSLDLLKNRNLKLDYIVASPRMKYYMKYSTEIYGIYLKYISKDDIHVYSIDEVFIDATPYLKTYGLTAKELAMKLIKEVLLQTGITATAGVGTNMYLAKIAMDIVAKKMPADENGVRLAELNERSYREQLWEHTPLQDFWMIGNGITNRLNRLGLYTMGDIALCSINDEEKLYKEFGVNAELIIDHAWGYEPCEIKYIKQYVPTANSISSGQVLSRGYSFLEGELIVKEMADNLALDLVSKRVVTKEIVLNIDFDSKSITDDFKGTIVTSYYGKAVPKPSHGSKKLIKFTNASSVLVKEFVNIYNRIVNKGYLVKKVTLAAMNIISEKEAEKLSSHQQLDLFNEVEQLDVNKIDKERKIQEAIVNIKKKYGKNAVVKLMDLEDSATTIERNGQVGGHKG